MDGSPLADLDVYRFGARCVLDGVSPYLRSDPIHGYPFTYPPFAAVLMVPLALLPTAVAAALWTGLSVACLAGTIALVAAALVMTAAIVKLARVEAVSTRDMVEAQRDQEVGSPA